MKLNAVPLRILILLSVTLAGAGCGSRHDLEKASGQAGFGVEMAKMNLWREAMFRFQRAIELNPGDAQAYNNLAVAYEANGDFDNAAKAYRQALSLDKSNPYIQKNYSRFVEFSSMNKKRAPKGATPAPGAAPAPASAPGGTPAAAPADPAAPPAQSPPTPTSPVPGSSPKPVGGTR
jgi:tetratricopeptide (TPR) repeat protein